MQAPGSWARGETGQCWCKGNPVYVALTTAQVPSTMVKVSFTDGFAVPAPTLSGSSPAHSLSVRSEGDAYDGKVQVEIEGYYTLVNGPTIYVPSGEWIRVRKDAAVATIANLADLLWQSAAIKRSSTFNYGQTLQPPLLRRLPPDP